MLPETLYWLMRELIENEGLCISELADDVLGEAARIVIEGDAENQ